MGAPGPEWARGWADMRKAERRRKWCEGVADALGALVATACFYAALSMLGVV